VSTHRFSHRTPVNPEGKPTVCLVRLGAFGDLVQAMSLVAQLKKDGYHVTLISQAPGGAIVEHDPNVVQRSRSARRQGIRSLDQPH